MRSLHRHDTAGAAPSERSTEKKGGVKVFIPKQYFKHAGYIKNDESVASEVGSRAQPRKPQTPFKERFNEKLEYPNPTQKSVRLHGNVLKKGTEDTLSMISKAVS